MNYSNTAALILFVFSSINSMDRQIVITESDNDIFAHHLQLALRCTKKIITGKKVADPNPVDRVLDILQQSFNTAEKNLTCLIKNEQLEGRIQLYNEIESDYLVQKLLKTIKDKPQNVLSALLSLKAKRISLAQDLLLKKYPHYWKTSDFITQISNQDTIEFMNKNHGFLLTSESIKDLEALFIYQILWADKTR